MNRAAVLAFAILSGTLAGAEQPRNELGTFFRQQAGFSDEEIARIARGTPVVKLISTQTPAEIFVFGAVFVNAASEAYIKLAFDIDRLRKLSGYLGIGLVGNPPKLSDFEGFTLEPEDIRDLEKCSPGKCDIQLPAEAMLEFRRTVNWSSPSAARQANDRLRQTALEFLQRYQSEGNSVLGTYRDKELPFDVRAQLKSWLGRSEALPIYFPELSRYLMDYPNATPRNLESLFYWEKVKFGLKPTLRLNHAIAYRAQGPSEQMHIVAVKQLYASHYFQLALEFTACVPGSRGASGKGFFLISLKGSTQQGLTGFRGSILRRAVVSKTRSAQEKALIAIKSALEQP
jgi:hypothetical protein